MDGIFPFPVADFDWTQIKNASDLIVALNQRVTELTSQKSALINEAQKIIDDANAQAKSIIDGASAGALATHDQAQAQADDADAYYTQKRKDADILISQANDQMDSVEASQAKLDQDRKDFEAYKLVEQKKIDSSNAEIQVDNNNLKNQQDSLLIYLGQLDQRKNDLDKRELNLLDDQKQIDARKKDLDDLATSLNSETSDLNQKKIDLNNQEKQNQSLLDNIKTQQDALIGMLDQKSAVDKLNISIAEYEQKIKDLDTQLKSADSQTQANNDYAKQLNEKQLWINKQLANVQSQIDILNKLRAGS